MKIFIKRIKALIIDCYLFTFLAIILLSVFKSIVLGEFFFSITVLDKYRYIYVVMYLLYFFISEYFFSKTIGKKMMGLKVVCEKKKLESILLRTLTRLFPFDLIYALANIDYKPLHDVVSKSLVEETIKVDGASNG